MSAEHDGFISRLNINHKVFWPPFSLLLFATIYSYLDNEGMVSLLKAGHGWVATSFGWA